MNCGRRVAQDEAVYTIMAADCVTAYIMEQFREKANLRRGS